MRRNVLVLAWLVLGALFLAGQTWGACPEDPNDNGECDTLHVDVWPGDDIVYGGFPHLVRFPIRVTSDIGDAVVDSVAGFMIPLCYVHSNPSSYCSLSGYWNNVNVHPWPDLENSIFRHLPDMATEEETNWMMHISEYSSVIPWDTRILDLDGTSHFWMSLVPTGSQDQRFWGGSRVLLATMTFRVQDTMSVCIETCIWPPMAYLAFSRSDAVTYRPRHLMPVCQDIHFPGGLPHFTICPHDQTHSANGHYASLPFEVTTLMRGDVVADVDASFEGSGLQNPSVFYTSPPPAEHVAGWVEYDVIDHCQAGGTMTLTAWDEYGGPGYCDFDIVLTNNPPVVNLPPTWRALAGYTMSLQVSATDMNGDEITGIELDGFWYEDDSLQPPVNPPTFDGENPGLFSWAPTGTETGTWIALFTATDECADSYTRELSIEVGMLYCGDCNADGEINLADVVYLVGDLFKEGPPPDPICRGDSNCSGVRDVGDVVLLINYLFKYGQAPCFECCP